jgi:hypothetical protein
MYHHIQHSQTTFCPHGVFMCFVWIWEQTAIISLYNINWLVFKTETGRLLCGTDYIFLSTSSPSLCFEGKIATRETKMQMEE